VQVEVEGRTVHVIVLHLGLISASRSRQIAQLQRFIAREIPAHAPLLVAGDFNDWNARLRPAMLALGLADFANERLATYPARLPLAQLDYVYARGLQPVGVEIPRGRIWWRMSDHLPLIAEFRF